MARELKTPLASRGKVLVEEQEQGQEERGTGSRRRKLARELKTPLAGEWKWASPVAPAARGCSAHTRGQVLVQEEENRII